VSIAASLLVTVGHLAAFVTVPVFAGVGVAFAVRSLRGGREAALRQTRSEALRHVAGYLERTRGTTWRSDEDSLDALRRSLRDHFVEVAGQLVVAARATLETAVAAAATEQDGVVDRLETVHRQQAALGELAGVVTAALDGATRGGLDVATRGGADLTTRGGADLTTRGGAGGATRGMSVGVPR